MKTYVCRYCGKETHTREQWLTHCKIKTWWDIQKGRPLNHITLNTMDWTNEDLNELDAKFDALTEHLGIEFVFEKVSDGSETADKVRCYARKKTKKK